MRDELQQALTTALRSRDRVALAALRSLRAALDNAEAVDVPGVEGPGSADVAGGVVGLGAADVARRELSDDDVARVVTAEIEERQAAAAMFASAGADDRAEQLRAEVAVLERFRA